MANKNSNQVMVNIPRSVTDQFYRYKMPDMITKVEGNGNGIKTVLMNCTDIGKSLARPPAYICKFLGFELGTLVIIDTTTDRYVVNGKNGKETLCQMLDNFIEKYVLCKVCRNPETVMVLSKGEIELRCKACGGVTRCNTFDKMGAFIVKNPPPSSEAVRRQKKEAREQKEREEQEIKRTQEELKKLTEGKVHSKKKTSSEKAAAADQEEDEEEWGVDLSAEAVMQRRKDMLGNATVVQANVIGGSTNADEEWISELEAAAKAKDVAKLEKLAKSPNRKTDAEAVKVIFDNIFDETILKQVLNSSGMLLPFCQTKDGQGSVLLSLVELSAKHESVLKSLPSILKGLYDVDVITEEISVPWWNETKALSEPIFKNWESFSKVALPFFDWLSADDEEESDEEEQ